MQRLAPLSDTIIVAVSRLVDDALTETREPSHSDIEFQINRTQLTEGDPKTQGQLAGKAKRVRATLSWAMEHKPEAGGLLVSNLLSLIKGCGGFREGSPNYIGAAAIQDAIEAFKTEGYELTPDGDLRPRLLDNLTGVELTEALQAYARRAKRGAQDAALVTGTGKDLLEATTAHILLERWGGYPEKANFPALLGQAFVALGLATPQDSIQPNEPAQKRLQRTVYEVACAVNHLRNKQGAGHGRPWLPSVTDDEATFVTELAGAIAEWLLAIHRRSR